MMTVFGRLERRDSSSSRASTKTLAARFPLGLTLALALPSLAGCSLDNADDTSPLEVSTEVVQPEGYPHAQLLRPLVMETNLAVRRGYPNPDGDEFQVVNQGPFASKGFRIAVLAGAQSHSIDVAGIAPGEVLTLSVGPLFCGQAVGVLVDADGVVPETNENDNFAGWSASCRID